MIPLFSPLGVVLYILLPFGILYLINALLSPPHAPGIPLIHEPPTAKSFSLRTRLTYLTNCSSLFAKAYQKFLKHGKPVILPGFGFRTELILPDSELKWAMNQPDSVLDMSAAFGEIDQPQYSLGCAGPITDPWQGMLVKSEMNSVLERVVKGVNEELGDAFDEVFGMDMENWKEVDLMEAVRTVVARASSRFTVGLPLCRNKEYIKDSFSAIDGCVITAGFVGGMPPILRPLLGPLVGFKARLASRRVRKHFESLYRERLATLKYSKDDPNHTEPQDQLQLMMRYAQRERPHELYDMKNMSARLTAANFGSMHQTTMQVVNMLLNVVGSDQEYNTIAVLREEMQQVLGDDTEWTKAKISNMVRADSVARETLRLHSFGGRSMIRKVMADNVVTDSGIHLPKGTILSFLSQQVHTDETIYNNPLKYDPFRFSRVRGIQDGKGVGSLSFVSTGPSFLAFSHGRHACPGRFLVDFEMKMILAYVLRKYDVRFPERYGDKRPENRWVAEALFPPEGVRVLVKRSTF